MTKHEFKKTCGRSPEYPQLEELLFESVKALRDILLVVKYSKIRTLAKNIASRKSIDNPDLKMCNWLAFVRDMDYLIV